MPAKLQHNLAKNLTAHLNDNNPLVQPGKAARPTSFSANSCLGFGKMEKVCFQEFRSNSWDIYVKGKARHNSDIFFYLQQLNSLLQNNSLIFEQISQSVLFCLLKRLSSFANRKK